jgi:hypothetical protein
MMTESTRAVLAPRLDARSSEAVDAAEEPCVMCGGTAVTWRKCKLVCLSCGTILKSCADL